MANPLSRFQPLARPVAAPGHCFLCRGHDGPFIDTLTNLPFEGAVIVCKTCIVEMFRQLDLEVVANQSEIDEISAAKFAEGAAVGQNYVLGALRDFVGEFVPADYSVPSDPGLPVDSEASTPGIEEVAGEASASDDGADEGSVEGLFAPSGAGRDDVSGDSNDGPDFGKSFGI